ncbi:MAG: hypothetical protein ABWY03_03010, partial [Microbacterium sp.]
SAAEDIAVEIGSHSDNTAEVTLEDMVTWWVLEPYSHSAPATTVEALAWSGRIGHESEATIDVRIHVAVEARSATTIGDRSNSAGEATVCYRLVWPRYEQARRSEIPCTDTAAPAPPVPTEHPQFTEDDTARVADILATVEGIDAIDAALHDAFPDDVVRIETALWNGETVVAVGIPVERECILVVRSPDGELTYPPFRRISLEPGETGCATDLYTSPPF